MTTTETEKVDLGHWELEFRVSHSPVSQVEDLHNIELIHLVYDSDVRMQIDITKDFDNLKNLTDFEIVKRTANIKKEFVIKIYQMNIEFATNR